MKLIFSFFLFFIALQLPKNAATQELQANININTSKLPTSVNKSNFVQLEKELTNFMNGRRWTSNNYESNEKIICNFFLQIEAELQANVYTATLTVQVVRPIYGTSYLSNLLIFQDRDISFKYVPSQPLEFNENRIQGSDALSANLAAIMAYYAYLAIGFYEESFVLKSGMPYFEKMQKIVLDAPESSEIKGWKPFDKYRSRYVLMENLLSPQYNIVHDLIYAFYRKGFDKMYENTMDGRLQLLQNLNGWLAFHHTNPNTMILPTFLEGKSDEFIQLYKNAPELEKNRVEEILCIIDASNCNRYQEQFK